MRDFTPKLPNQRWHIHEPADADVAAIADRLDLSPLLARLLVGRGFNADNADLFLHPDRLELPPPVADFPDLDISLELIQDTLAAERPIAICGDYDADGMTSTALLLRALRAIGANVDYAIPSRMSDGYGINSRLVNEFAEAGVGLIITVDNGISAYDPIEEARELGMEVIVTDHHDVPPLEPPASSILNPKLAPPDSPYRGMAGVGVAYMLAMHVAEPFGCAEELRLPMLELLTLGTIADLAPLSGVNRHWVSQGLHLLANSQIPGIQALVQVSGAKDDDKKPLKPDAIGFRLGPRVNAVGRIGNPQLVIELLSTDDAGMALERAMQCEQINQTRQAMCQQIGEEAIAQCQPQAAQLAETRVLVPLNAGWHHGVIGIVASRLVERYGVPVFICTYEDEEQQHVRGSARGIPEFNVFEALEYCKDLLTKHGGHPAAGGFSLPTENLAAFRSRLSEFACRDLEPHHLKPLVQIDAPLSLNAVDFDRFGEVERLQPCGIGNPPPVFYAANVRVLEQRVVGKGHIKLVLAQSQDTPDDEPDDDPRPVRAIAWRWGEYFPLPTRLDVAYRLKENHWNGNVSVEMEVVGARLPDGVKLGNASPQVSESSEPERYEVNGSPSATVPHAESNPAATPSATPQADAPRSGTPAANNALMAFDYQGRTYQCGVYDRPPGKELRIRNDRGQVLAVRQGSKTGLLGKSRDDAQEVDVRQPHFYDLIKAAMAALNRAAETEAPLSRSS